MNAGTCFKWLAVSAAILFLGVSFTRPSHALSPQSSPNPFHQWLQQLASARGGSVTGNWRGGKTESDPVHGGYLNLSFTFAFSPDGSYQEAVYMGGRQVMSANGTYQQSGSHLAFKPQQCSFASPDLGEVVKFVPIPTDTLAEDTISLYTLEGGSQMSLKDPASGEDWGLKPAR